MKTFRNIKKRLKRVAQKQHIILDRTIHMHSNEDAILTGIGRYTYAVDR